MLPCLTSLALLPLALGAQESPSEGAPQRTSHIGRYVGTVSGLASPRAVAFDGEGRLWVAEAGDGSTSARVRAHVLGFGDDGTLMDHESVDTRGAGSLVSPAGLAIDEAGFVYVSDDELHAVRRLGPGGKVDDLALHGASVGSVVQPAGLGIGEIDGEGTLVVSDAGNGRVQLMALDQGDWRALLRGPIVRPVDACVMADGTLVVADAARQRLDHVSASGEHLRAFSDWGSFPSLVSTPLGVEALGALVMVADTENHRVQAFDPAQELPLAYRFGVHAIRPGEGEGKLHYPRDIAVRRDGDLIAIPEPLDDRVQLFARAPGAEPEEDNVRASIGGPSAHFGPQVSGSGQFLVTCSPESHKVQLHDMRLEEPIKIADLFGYGTRLGMLRGPSGLWLDDEGRTLLVTDVGNRRLTRVRLDVKPDEPLAQMPEIATYEDALDFSMVDLASLGSVMRGGEEVKAAPIIPGPVCIVDCGEERFIVVADNGNEALIVLDDSLTPLQVVGGLFGGPVGALGKITGLAAIESGFLVTCRNRETSMNLQPGASLYEFARAFPGEPGEAIFTPTARGSKAPQRRLGGVAVRGSEIFVTVPDQAKVVRLRSMDPELRSASSGVDDELAPVDSFGAEGLGRGEFLDPRGLAVLGDGRLVVIDHGNHRGQIFDAEGNFLSGFGSRLYTAQLRR